MNRALTLGETLGPCLISRARGVVVSHPLSMREALGSIPSVSMCGPKQVGDVRGIKLLLKKRIITGR